ncbi:MAG: SagB/ThcOx family dehydrogenase [Okeania sp. SIO2G4]|uniref:SagB/ThcOx family dehydrogenase n=1 Tax=unclassified Okeania TaxID=2634635 RepID=UPI0013BAE9B7|nr:MULTISPECIES: SagB/ThcOx family dehydrogenase [unclassified Okeania]NEP05258.1 SagB/ThcOx family dehydrogenase [Okeania sp. SIO4D6]NEP73786.1 SagB/ThcOx family dehydrogenase [Okeania sp. SIO2G5]NEP94444.1 SagB/ThcOx family dehydrogenase [Okeania sp. SIO2F5]NEQ94473.1 SagB/ThcOx family dehydrogenase [Okeania sp. SIO2G4]
MTEVKQSIAQHYHERTKYDPETIASKNHQLDWEKQPIPFKEYKVGTTIDLKPYLQEQIDQEKDLGEGERLSNLFLCSYGLTGKVATIMGNHYLRAAPSAGGLYPAEVYLISRGTPLLPAGLYNYQAKTHSLLRFWDNRIWPELQDACFWHPALENTKLAIAITTIFYRSAWRYEDRAYRRIFLDTGHLLGNIELASAFTNYRPHLIGGFTDEAINQMLYLDTQEEQAIAIIALADLLDIEQNLSQWESALPSSTQTDYPMIPDGELLKYLHQAAHINSNSPKVPNWKTRETPEYSEDKYNFPFCTKVSTVTPSISWGKDLRALRKTILKRRSTREYTGEPIALKELLAALDFTYQPDHYINQGLDRNPDYFDLSLIETFIAVSGVDGLEEGCYYYAPVAQELRQIRFKNFRQELHFLCLGQELGRDAAVVLFHTADLKKAVAKYGDRVYRYLHADAGHLGQRLNLAAIYLNLGVSGIGGFFDDYVNEVLGIPVDEAVVYISTLGQARSQ